MGIEPDHPEGYVYYIKLNTEKGVFYKIGFTKMSNIEKRFSYGGSDNYKLIEKVLMFKYCMYGYRMEQKLHFLLSRHQTYNRHTLRNLFRDFRQHPLFKDGQTELYKSDVLGLDPNPPFRLFSSSKSDLVKKRALHKNRYYELISKDEINKKEARDYKTLDSFLAEPLFISKEEFIEYHGDWVVSFVRWAIRNSATSFEEDTTIHGAKPLPFKKNELLALKKLNPVWSCVDSIPKEIGHLTNLEVVTFNRTDINSIPKELYGLQKLITLDLFCNNINYISSEIKNLRLLKKLDLSGNKITKIPTEIKFLTNLEELDLSHNKITKIPLEIKFLKKLKVLNLSHNFITYIPEEIISLNTLKKFYIDANQWKFLYDLGIDSNLFTDECYDEYHEIEKKILLKYDFLVGVSEDSELRNYSEFWDEEYEPRFSCLIGNHPYDEIIKKTVNYIKEHNADHNLTQDDYVDICYEYIKFCTKNNLLNFEEKLAKYGASINNKLEPNNLFLNDVEDLPDGLWSRFESEPPDDLWSRSDSAPPGGYVIPPINNRYFK